MSLSPTFAAPYFTGTATTSDLRWDVGIAGHGYMIDMQYVDQFGRETVPMIRQQSDTADKPGENSLNPAGLWRRSVESWHHGAGQVWLDKPDSDPFRFNASKGVDPWTRYGLSLLPATSLITGDSSTNQHLVVASERVYKADGGAVKVSPVGEASPFTTASGLPGGNVASLATDGAYVYAGTPTGVFRATGTVFASYATGAVTEVAYVKGRLMATSGPAVYNILTSGALPAPLYTHPNPSWNWNDMANGPGHIYLQGGDKGKTLIYKTAVKPDGTALDIPTVAAELPDDEVGHSMIGYLGYVVIGTSRGLRFAQPDANGNLILGALIDIGRAVLCAEGQGQYVWFGWTNYDATSTGLGRLDLTTFIDDLTPAYATDLMATGQGPVQAVVTFKGARLFTVSGSGLWQEQRTKVDSGTVTSGRITYGLPDIKTAVDVDARHDPLPAGGAVTLSVTLDAGTPVPLGVSDVDGSSASPDTAYVLNQLRGTFFELTTTLTGGVVLRRVTLRADPAAERTIIYQAPLLFHENVTVRGDVERAFDVDTEFAFIRELCASRAVVNYQEADDTHRVVVEDFTWKPYERTTRFWTGTLIARMKGI